MGAGHQPPARALEIRSYDAAWEARGRAIVRELQDVLGVVALRTEHIGSTAIAGMAAKPVLDIQVSVADLDDAARAFDGPLARLGLIRGRVDRDHVPAGLDDDPGRWAKRFWSRAAPPPERVN